MVRSLIQAMIAAVIGLALLPVVNTFVEDLTGTGGALETATVAPLINLIPTLYVIILIVGLVAYVYVSRK